MSTSRFADIFSPRTLTALFPADRADQFFDALFGDAAEGAYDISLSLDGHDEGTDSLRFHLNLTQRPGKCLACNLTTGLPEVFSRHPIINIAGLVKEIESLLVGKAACGEWRLGPTQTISKSLYAIPLTIQLKRQTGTI